MTDVAVIGCGLTGGAVASSLASQGLTVACYDLNPDRAKQVSRQSLQIRELDSIEDIRARIAVLASPDATHVSYTAQLIEKRISVVSLARSVTVGEDLYEFEKLSHQRDAGIVMAGFAPGLSCLLARLAVSKLEEFKSIVVSRAGTAGPACAREHHAALKGLALNWYDGRWESTQSGTGRLLHWFPEPLGGRDCYRGSMIDPWLLHRAFPEVNRISARIAANRRDRFTSALPMLRPPHRDGGPGAIRVEVNGMVGGAVEEVVYGVAGSPSWITAQLVTAVAIRMLGQEHPLGLSGLAQWAIWRELLSDVMDAGISVEKY